MIWVFVRWHDGYLEKFICDEVRHGSDLLWLQLVTGQNRHIPLRGNVRWFSVNPTSREPKSAIHCGANLVEKKPED